MLSSSSLRHALLCSALLACGAAAAYGARADAQPNRAGLKAAYFSAPLAFEANRGQAGTEARFLSRGSGYTLLLAPTEAVLHLRRSKGAEKPDRVRMKVVGANPRAQVTGGERLPGIANYFLGNDPNQWRTRIPTYARVNCRSVYPGVDMVYYGSQRTLEYDFIVKPGADPSRIALAFDGAQARMDACGDLVLTTAGGELRQHRPVVYQKVGGTRRPVDGGYARLADGRIGFKVGAYDRSRPLVIDPLLAYNTYLGGTGDDVGADIAVDESGSAYVVGRTDSTNFPAAGAPGKTDVFVAKLAPNGSSLIYSTYLGGSEDESTPIDGRGNRVAIALDQNQNAYVTGFTLSEDFPTTSGAFDRTYSKAGVASFGDSFVARLSADGASLVYSTYLGGSGWDYPDDITVDAAGNAYICGGTNSEGDPSAQADAAQRFPVTAGAFQIRNHPSGLTDAFLVKLNSAGSTVLYGTLLGGDGTDEANAITLGPTGDAYISGNTDSDLPAVGNPFQSMRTAGREAFIARFNTQASGAGSLTYYGYFGGDQNDDAFGVAVDPLGNIAISGTTSSTNLPVLNAIQATHPTDFWYGFVVKLDPTGHNLVFSTYLGPNAHSAIIGGMAVDQEGALYVTGGTYPDGFPLKSAITISGSIFDNAFLTKFSPTGQLVYSTEYGGSGGDNGRLFREGSVAVDSVGNAYITGYTDSDDLPPVNRLQTVLGGKTDAFVAKFGNTALPDPLGPPTTLAAIGRTSSSISLNWLDNASQEDGFEIQRRLGIMGTFAPVGTVGRNVRVFTDTGLPPATQYQYQVRAFKGNAFSAFTNIVDGTTLDVPPAAPTGLVATVITGHRVDLAWVDGSSNEAGFEIERRVNGGAFTPLGGVGAGVQAFSDTTAVGLTQYTYRVRAENSGGVSDYATSNDVTTPAAPASAPTLLEVTPSAANSDITVRWRDNGPDTTSFRVERKAGSGPFAPVGGPLNASTTSLTDDGLDGNTTYTYRVIAINTVGESDPSNELSALTRPAPPANLQAAVIGSGQVRLTWSEPTGAAAFRIFRKTTGNYLPVGTVNGSTTTFTNSNVLSNATYTYHVKAVNATGESAPSADVTVSTTAPLVSFTVKPGSVKAKKTAKGTLTLGGNAPSGGLTVTVASDSPAAKVPATVKVGAGKKSATFAVKTTKVTATTVAHLTASYNGVTLPAQVMVKK